MTSVGNILLEKEILLESGTNELEILVFRIADYTFGINVAKVREVLPSPDITNLPKAHTSIVGVFKLRDVVVPVVSLYRHLDTGNLDNEAEATLILTDFNNHQTAFLVDSVERIHRLSWKYIMAVPGLVSLAQTPVTAVARIEDRLVIMLDFEMISDQVTEQFFRTGPVDNPLGLPREQLRILMADDSPTVRQAIDTTLRSSGYTNLKIFKNGAEVWDWLTQRLQEAGQASEVADLIISDVEMPQMDGFHLTKRIKEHPELRQLPVLLYSSIVSPDNRKKGAAVGADAQVAKPDLDKVVQLADDLISKAQRNWSAVEKPAQAEQPAADKPRPGHLPLGNRTMPRHPSPRQPRSPQPKNPSRKSARPKQIPYRATIRSFGLRSAPNWRTGWLIFRRCAIRLRKAPAAKNWPMTPSARCTPSSRQPWSCRSMK